MILTRKLQLRLLDESHHEMLKQLNLVVYRAYNSAVNSHYFSELFKDNILLRDEQLRQRREKIEKEIEKLKHKLTNSTLSEGETVKTNDAIKKQYRVMSALSREARSKMQEIYATSEKNFGYQRISEMFSQIPSTIRTCINNEVYSNFHNDISDIRKGNRSVRTYRKGIPIPFQLGKNKIVFSHDNDDILFHWIKGIDFKIVFGTDKSARRSEVEKIMSGEYKMSDSKLHIKGKKIFLLLALNQDVESCSLKKDVSIGVDLGIVYPAYVSTNSGVQHKHLGSMDDLFRIRVQMQKRRRRLQKDIASASGGKGRDKKLKALDRLKQKERNYVRTYNHYISKEIIKFALENKAATIFIEDLSGFAKTSQNNEVVLRNWSFFELQSMLEYKAELKGIAVKKINPKFTSQTCAVCGKRGNRESQKHFICLNKNCKNFSKEILADFNAALNIANGGVKEDKTDL